MNKLPAWFPVLRKPLDMPPDVVAVKLTALVATGRVELTARGATERAAYEEAARFAAQLSEMRMGLDPASIFVGWPESVEPSL